MLRMKIYATALAVSAVTMAAAGSKTRAEKSGSAILQRRLKRDQPLPQTVYAARPDAQGVTVAPIRLRVKK